MCIQSDRPIKKVELADILSQHADAYIASHGVSSIQRKAINSISHCRTAALGGHVLRCDHCGKLEIAYNSCRYRHCPKCQMMAVDGNPLKIYFQKRLVLVLRL